MSGNLSPSLVRTGVPLLFGGLLTKYGLDVDDPDTAILLTGVISYLYYVVARFLEVFGGAKWGYVLGIAKSPGYSQADAPPAQPAPVGEPDEH